MLPTDLTVSALVPRGDRFLIVEERASGVVVLTQPGGHIEAGESPEAAAVRETLEETRWGIDIDELLGVYLWIHPQTRQQFLRIVFTATCLAEDTARQWDDGIHAVHWFTREDLLRRRNRLRTPVVLRCIDDYLSGARPPEGLLAPALPVQQNVDAMLARASLV